MALSVVTIVSGTATADILQFEPGDGVTETGFRRNVIGDLHGGVIQYVEDGITMDATSGVFHLGLEYCSGSNSLYIFTMDAPFEPPPRNMEAATHGFDSQAGPPVL